MRKGRRDNAASIVRSLANGRLRRVLSRRMLLTAAVVFALAASLWGLGVVRRARGVLDEARTGGDVRDAVRFEKKRLGPLKSEGVSLFQATRAVRAIERFRDSYFAATDGGLVELSQSGRVVRRFGVLEGLGESDLTSLAAYGGRLYAGTRSRGLIAFDGEHFEQYVWTDREAKSVTALAADQGKLLVGTFAGGLLEFDGAGFREVRAGEGRARLDAVTVIRRYGPRLYAGTFAGGLWVSEGGRWAHFTAADGLASERVVGVVESDGEALAATDFGLSAAAADGLVLSADAEGARAWRTVMTVPTLSGSAESGGRVTLCKDDGEFALFDVQRGATNVRAEDVNWIKPRAARSDARVVALDGSLWLLDSGGVRRSTETSSQGDARRGEISFADFASEESPQTPTSNLVSALAFDAGGRLWAGSFRNGLNVFTPSGSRLAHIESDDLREVNALAPDGEGGVFAATSQGIFHLDAALRPERVGTSEGSSPTSVSHVALLDAASEHDTSRAHENHSSPRQLAAATPKGLALFAQGGARVLTTVQGLPSNSVYSIWPAAGRVYAGTLGGLVEVASGRVVRVFKDSNSALKVNWVTAVGGAGGRLFVGTYGGGVFELLPSGDLRGFADETGRAFVNQNAMWGDDERLYVGTLDGALVFDLRSQRWTRVREELPAPSVLSVAGRGREVYFGTTAGLARFDKSFFDSAD